ncbi:hypothetical protein GC106_66330 [Kibdelosporangium sp. 4NS15]|uniref:Sporulation and spore germination n=1 Tax=Kibdelosporangium persicum TaxID=2698649 RepID=A0ABX2FEX9_9PSEU|nr:hypothetical protein [Kibdelosporangium persicum]NRN69376.1 hypothetical protein [Kibdelosporangium persicum]
MRNPVGMLGSAVVLSLVACTGPELTGRQPLNTEPVTDSGPEVCSLLPRQAIAQLTARAEGNLTSVGDITADSGQCEVLVSEDSVRQPVTSLRIDAGQVGMITRLNTVMEIAEERAARAPLGNPLRTGTDHSPAISLAITCGNRPVHIGIGITGYDVRRKSIDQDLADLSGIVAAKYGDRLGCRAEVAPPLPEVPRGAVRMMAGDGGPNVPSGPAPGPSTSIGHVEALTTAQDGSVYFVGRKYPTDVNPRNADEDAGRWGDTLRILRVRTDGVVEVAWDPNLAPFSTDNDPVPGDLSEKLRLQGRDTLGSVSGIVLHQDQAWLLPSHSASRPGDDRLSRPVRIVQLTGGRAVDLRAIKAPVEADTTRIKDQNGLVVPGGIDSWNTARFGALTFDGDTPVLLDVLQARVWRIDALRDGKVLEATVLRLGTEIASGAGAAGLASGRFAVSTRQSGLAILDSRGRVLLSTPVINAEIDGIGPSPLDLGRRQVAAAGDDVIVHAVASQVAAPAVVRVDGQTGTTRTIQVSGYPGPRDPASDVRTTRFARSFGTAANATTLFATGWPVSALGAVGQNVLIAPYGTRIFYELVPRR